MRKTFSALKLSIGRLSGAVDDDSLERAGECAIDAVEFIKRERPWSFLRGVEQTISLTAGTDTYDTPTGLLNVQKVYYKNSDGTTILLRKITDDEFLRDWQGVDIDEPIVYRILEMDTTNYQSKIQVAHPPSAAFISTYGSYLYIEQTDNIDAPTEDSEYFNLPGDFTQAIEYLGASKLCLQQGDQVQAQAYLGAYNLAIDVLKADDAVRYGKLFPSVPILGSAPNSWRRGGRRDYQRVP